MLTKHQVSTEIASLRLYVLDEVRKALPGIHYILSLYLSYKIEGVELSGEPTGGSEIS